MELVLFNLSPVVQAVARFEWLFSFYPDGVKGIVMDHFKHFCTYYVNSTMVDSLGLPVEGAYEWPEVIEDKIQERYRNSSEWKANLHAYPSVNHEDTISHVTTMLVELIEMNTHQDLDLLTHEILEHGKMQWYENFIGIPLHSKQSWNWRLPRYTS